MAGFFDFFRRHSNRTTGEREAAAVPELAFREIKKTWSAEDNDITEQENGFDWLPGSHRVHVRVMREEDGDDPSRHRLWITTDVLRSLPPGDNASASIVSTAAAHCPTFAPVCWTRGGSDTGPDGGAGFYFFASAYVNGSTVGWLSGFLARMSLLQPLMAERSASSFAKIAGGTPAFAMGSKRQADGMVFEVDDMLRAQSGGMSNWIGSPEFGHFAERYARNDDCFGTADQAGMSLETPFGSDTALIRFDTQDSSPIFGHGLFIQTWIRSTDTREQICANAARLNYLEATQWTDFPQLGGWFFHASDDERLLVHSCFIPNTFFRDGLVTNYGLWAIARALWVREILLPDIRSKTMAEILKARHGL